MSFLRFGPTQLAVTEDVDDELPDPLEDASRAELAVVAWGGDGSLRGEKCKKRQHTSGSREMFENGSHDSSSLRLWPTQLSVIKGVDDELPYSLEDASWAELTIIALGGDGSLCAQNRENRKHEHETLEDTSHDPSLSFIGRAPSWIWGVSSVVEPLH
ncbi:MAG TPA: hypothetical protein VJZ76_12850 [Thermoanaerobaculia bacterium]|nr:hypothetical protein [Thermoanaerobaculia bacterium]